MALWVWARYLEDASLWDYGISATPQWALECLVGYLAFVGAILIWAGIGVATGTATVSTGPPSDGLGIIVISVVSLALHAAVQQVVFFRVILGSALEGLYARELAQPLVIGISVIVAAISFG
ncbi:MAG: hypothetical protein U5K37_08910 [Natrialbaceae archaeon]|nr:hypothetical protein [Natrialbaceae archaeon]